MEVDMALVRQAGAAGTVSGRAQVPGTVVAPAIPALPGHPPIQEMAAAVPSLPAKAWSVIAGLGLTGTGAIGAWNIHLMMQPTPFQIGDTPSTFAAMFVFSAAVERVLEPFSRFMPGWGAQEKYEKAVADVENGVPGAMNAAAHFKAAVESARASRGVLMWGLATFAATLLSAGSGFYLLRALSANPAWDGVATWADALVTGLVVGSGTKPVHDVLTRVQQRTNAAQTPF
jgi:hypothetical protein